MTYDLVGNVTSATDELGRTTYFGYDNVNRQTTITDPLLHISTTSYDTEGNVTSMKDALDRTTSYLYDRNNRQVRVIDANLGVTLTSYDVVGNVASIIDSVNNVTTYRTCGSCCQECTKSAGIDRQISLRDWGWRQV
jgi:YD repeat-containing protein